MRKHIVYHICFIDLFYILYCPNIMSVCSPLHTRVNAYDIDWRCISYHHHIHTSIVLCIYSSFSFFFDSCLFVKLCSLFFSRIDPNCRDAADQSNYSGFFFSFVRNLDVYSRAAALSCAHRSIDLDLKS